MKTRKEITELLKNRDSILPYLKDALRVLPDDALQLFINALPIKGAMEKRINEMHFARYGENKPKLVRPNNQREVEQLMKGIGRIK